MKLQDSDIISAARDLRDEQNEKLYVSPSPFEQSEALPLHGGAGRGSAPTPLWWGATAAAVVIAFFMGKSLTPSPSPVGEGSSQLQELAQSQSLDVNTPLSHGRGDGGEASIIREVIHEVVHDTIFETRIVRVPVPTQQLQTAQVSGNSSQPSTLNPQPSSPGCSMLCDDIRYDLLTGN